MEKPLEQYLNNQTLYSAMGNYQIKSDSEFHFHELAATCSHHHGQMMKPVQKCFKIQCIEQIVVSPICRIPLI